MTRDTWARLAAMIVLTAATGAVACSGGSAPSAEGAAIDAGAPTQPFDANDAGAARSGPKGASGGTTKADGSGDQALDAADQACAGAPSEGTCLSCCRANHGQGSTVFDNAIVRCVCDTACTSVCAGTCAPDGGGATPAAGDPCDACITKAVAANGACAAPVRTTCQANADCAVQAECFQQCQGKPAT